MAGYLFVQERHLRRRVIGAAYTRQRVDNATVYGDFIRFGKSQALFVLEAEMTNSVTHGYGLHLRIKVCGKAITCFVKDKHSVKSLNLDYLVLDFEGVLFHNNHVRERTLFWMTKKD